LYGVLRVEEVNSSEACIRYCIAEATDIMHVLSTGELELMIRG